MPSKENRIGRIEVRFIPDFFKSPAVYTLLATMPVAERSRLITSLLDKHIQQTQHPAGNTDVQLNLVARILSDGNQQGTPAEGAQTIATFQSLAANGGVRSKSLAFNNEDEVNHDSGGIVADATGSPAPIGGEKPGNKEESAVGPEEDTINSSATKPLSSMASRWISE